MKTAEKIAGLGYSILMKKVSTNDFMRKNQRKFIAFNEEDNGRMFESEIGPSVVNSILVFLKYAVYNDRAVFNFFESFLSDWARKASNCLFLTLFRLNNEKLKFSVNNLKLT